MIYFLFLLLGFMLALAFIRKPVQIKIHHIYENVEPEEDAYDLTDLEQEMLKEDPKEEELYKNLDNVLLEVNDVMGGSDRIDRN